MPIYEYQCRECHHVFEKLVSLSSRQDIECEKCRGTNVHKLISASVSIGSETAGKGECQPRGGFT